MCAVWLIENMTVILLMWYINVLVLIIIIVIHTLYTTAFGTTPFGYTCCCHAVAYTPCTHGCPHAPVARGWFTLCRYVVGLLLLVVAVWRYLPFRCSPHGLLLRFTFRYLYVTFAHTHCALHAVYAHYTLQLRGHGGPRYMTVVADYTLLPHTLVVVPFCAHYIYCCCYSVLRWGYGWWWWYWWYCVNDYCWLIVYWLLYCWWWKYW